MAVTNSTFSQSLDREHRNPVAEFLWMFFSTPEKPCTRATTPEYLMGWPGVRKADCNKIARHYRLDGWDENATHVRMVRALDAAWEQGKLKIDGEIARRAAASSNDPIVAALAAKVSELTAAVASMTGKTDGDSKKNRASA